MSTLKVRMFVPFTSDQYNCALRFFTSLSRQPWRGLYSPFIAEKILSFFKVKRRKPAL